MNDNAKIGTALLGLGCLFIVLGVVFFFDRMFLSLGNVMLLGGLLLTRGVSRSQRFFVKKAKESGFRGVGCFFGGVVLVVFFKRPLLGMCLEGFGFVNLFANFFPIALSAMRSMPVLGDVLAMPGVSAIADKLAGVEPRRAQRSRRFASTRLSSRRRRRTGPRAPSPITGSKRGTTPNVCCWNEIRPSRSG